MSIEIRNEDDFQAYFMKKQYHESFFVFPKIRRIAGKTISPEIDLLHIDLPTKTVKGYEFKFLNHKTNDANYRRIREGLGQAILYFQLGVDISFLVLGISNEIPNEKRSAIFTRLIELEILIKRLENVYRFDSLGLLLWDAKSDEFVTRIKPKRKFPINSFEDYKLSKDCLINMKFRSNRNFWKKHGL